MSRFFVQLVIICVYLMFISGSVYSKNIPVPPVANGPSISLANVQTICIGYINGDPIEAEQLKNALTVELKSVGFTVDTKIENCDAKLLGRLWTKPVSLFGSKTHSQTSVSAWVSMKLITSNYETLWEKSFEPMSGIPLGVYPVYMYARSKGYVRGKGYILSNGIYNRSLDIANGLAKAKKRANE